MKYLKDWRELRELKELKELRELRELRELKIKNSTPPSSSVLRAPSPAAGGKRAAPTVVWASLLSPKARSSACGARRSAHDPSQTINPSEKKILMEKKEGGDESSNV